MTDTARPRRSTRRGQIRRLLVTLDASAGCLDVLDDLVALAAGLDAEMRGVVVEDTDLIDLAGYRLVTAYPPQSGSAALEPALIDRIIRRHIDRVRHAVERTAERHQVHVELEVRRGRTAIEVVRSARKHDLIVISMHARGFTVSQGTVRHHAGPTAREVIRDAQRPVFVLGSPSSLAGPIYAVFDGSPASRLALDLVASLSTEAMKRRVVVLVSAPDDARASELEKEVRSQTPARRQWMRIERLADSRVDALCAAVARRPGVLVIGGTPETLQATGAEELLERTGCSLLLVRTPTEKAEQRT